MARYPWHMAAGLGMATAGALLGCGVPGLTQ